MREKKRKARRFSRTRFIVLLFLVVVGGLLYLFHPAVLTAAGRYLALEGAGKADVVILEGEEMIKEQAVKVGMGLIESGRAHGLVVVYQDSNGERTFGKPTDYASFLSQEIGRLGLKGDQIKVFSVPQEHPITLNEARAVLSRLSGDHIRSAILVSQDFHSRRSYWAYKQVGIPLGIDIISHPYFPRFSLDNWWRNAWGGRNFVGEAVKFLYYVSRGYVPLKSLVMAQ